MIGSVTKGKRYGKEWKWRGSREKKDEAIRRNRDTWEKYDGRGVGVRSLTRRNF